MALAVDIVIKLREYVINRRVQWTKNIFVWSLSPSVNKWIPNNPAINQFWVHLLQMSCKHMVHYNKTSLNVWLKKLKHPGE